jgi:hypothetical protein
MKNLFDYHALADRIGISAEQLALLEACLRRQLGSDDMMFELRMLRTLEAIAQGRTSLDQAIREFSSEPVSQSAAHT